MTRLDPRALSPDQKRAIINRAAQILDDDAERIRTGGRSPLTIRTCLIMRDYTVDPFDAAAYEAAAAVLERRERRQKERQEAA